MQDLDILNNLNNITENKKSIGTHSLREKVSKHKDWINSIQKEYPDPNENLKIGVYIRYYNQTKHENYLENHKMQFESSIKRCPNWELVDFYVDEGLSATNMETSKEWNRLVDDAVKGKVNIILTQKISNISKKFYEIVFCARLLANLPKPVGIYFISEDIYTTASYYLNDLKDTYFLPNSTNL